MDITILKELYFGAYTAEWRIKVGECICTLVARFERAPCLHIDKQTYMLSQYGEDAEEIIEANRYEIIGIVVVHQATVLA